MSLDNLLLGRSSALYRRIEALLITLFLIARGGVWRTLGCIYGLRRIDRIAGWEAGSQHTKTGVQYIPLYSVYRIMHANHSGIVLCRFS